MGETFYAALGLDPGADEATIRAAYRERVKQFHPDVSDDPAAPREFKRLTTARDVLVDEQERATYDRLGHETYVRRHLEGDGWDMDEATGGVSSETGQEERSRSSAAATTADGTTGSTERESSPGNDERRSAEGRQSNYGGHGWETTAEPTGYRPAGVPTEPATLGRRLRRGLGSVGPWLVVHAVFLLWAAGVAWFAYVRTASATALTVPAAAFGGLVFGLALFLTTLHLVTLVHG
jgi:curved DNA-binding protein CbpA